MPVVHEEKLRVNWVDTDASGRIHYTAALRYFEIWTLRLHGVLPDLAACGRCGTAPPSPPARSTAWASAQARPLSTPR